MGVGLCTALAIVSVSYDTKGVSTPLMTRRVRVRARARVRVRVSPNPKPTPNPAVAPMAKLLTYLLTMATTARTAP